VGKVSAISAFSARVSGGVSFFPNEKRDAKVGFRVERKNQKPVFAGSSFGAAHTKKRTRIPHELEAFASEGCKRSIGC
jgi:hypothetical protein